MKERVFAIVVLGCRVTASGRPSQAAKARAKRAAELFHEGLAQCVVAAGGRRHPGGVEAICLRNELISHGVPREAIAVELCSLTTWENAVYSRQLLLRSEMPPASPVAVVTCPWHIARALENFCAAGFVATGFASQIEAAGRYRQWTRSTHEVVGRWLDRRFRHGSVAP